MAVKYNWKYEDEFTCCWEYLDFVFGDGEDYSLNGLVEIIAKKLPHIDRGSIRMKVQNIKCVALEAGLEDGLKASPLSNYSKACKRAFDEAGEKYLEMKKEENYQNERASTVPDGQEGDAQIYSQDPDDSHFPVVTFADTLNKIFVNRTIYHKGLGVGKVTDINKNYLTVEFNNKTSMFPFPDAIESFLLFENPKCQAIAKLMLMHKRGNDHSSSGIKYDKVEDTPQYKKIEKKLEELIEAQIGNHKYLGFCHLYWMTKKRILREKYGIEWKSPAELNPHIMFD